MTGEVFEMLFTREFEEDTDMFMFAYNLKKFQLREKHPDWTERQLNHKAYELIEKGCR